MVVRRILFLHFGVSSNRGSEKVLLGLLGNLDKKRFRAILVCNHKLLAREAEKLGIKTYMLDWAEIMVDRRYVRLQFLKSLKIIIKLSSIIRNEFAKLVVCHSGLTTQAGLYAARITGVPVLGYIHAPYTKRYIHLYGLNRTDKTIFVSNAIRHIMTEKAGFRSELVIHNGIDTNKFHSTLAKNKEILERFSIGENKIIIGQVGSLINLKGVDLLIEAGKLLADKRLDFHIILVGAGSDEASFRRLVRELSMSDHVTFYGNSETPEYFYQNIFDINVLASRSEAFGLTLAEGSACGLPCVGSNTGGIPEVICNNETGLLFTSGNAEDLADKLEILIRNPSLRKEMGDKGQAYISENLSLRIQLDRFSDVLMDLAL